MTLSHQPSIATDGLVFNYDMNNYRSYVGPPIQNVLNQITPQGQSVSAGVYNFSSGAEYVAIPTLGVVYSKYMDMYNNYPTSNNCCPSPFTFGNSLSVSGGTQYTYAILYKSMNGYYNANYMYHYEFGPSGYITEYGVNGVGGYGSQMTDLGDSWTWSASVFTTNASTTSINTGAWMYEYNTYNRLYIAKVMITPGDYRNLHPRYWPDVGTTRSTSQTLFDACTNATMTATSLTYAGDGTISFDGSGNYCTGSDLGQLKTFTAEAWFKPTSYPNNAACVVSSAYPGNNSTVNFKIGYEGGSAMYGGYYNGGWYYSPGVATSLNTWQQVVCTYDGSSLAIYSNGASGGSNSSSTVPNSSGAGFRIGRRWDIGDYFAGNIGVVRIYNRALSATEVLQNFNALRGRYGI